MDEILEIVAELGVKLHPDRIEAIAGKIASLGSFNDFFRAKSSFGPNVDNMLIQRFERAWQKYSYIKPSELSIALRSSSWTSSLHNMKSSVELVWTGPSTGVVPVRHTEQVLCQVIRSSTKKLYIVSYVAHKVDIIIRELCNAAERGVSINLIFEASTEHGGAVSFDSVRTMQKTVSTANIFVWEKTGPSVGSVHAKCAVADGQLSFITSANFTTAAMERNMELGVLVEGGHIPVNLERHLEALIYTGTVQKV